MAGREAKLSARADLEAPALAALAVLDEAGFRSLFAGSPVKRIGHARFLRNVLIAVGNSGVTGLGGAALARLGHPSPLVRAMAVWAGLRLLGPDPFHAASGGMPPDEPDPDVRAEWEAA